MSTAKRYTPEMTERLKQLAATGHPATSIAVALTKMSPPDLPITPLSVRVKACSLGIRLKRRAAKYGTEIRCNVSMDVWERLRKMASNRGLSVAKLAQLLVEIIVDEGMINAIIDEDWRRSRRKRRSPDAPRIGRPRGQVANVTPLRQHVISAGEISDIKILAEEQRLDAVEIGRRIGRSAETIARVAARHGIAFQGTPPSPR